MLEYGEICGHRAIWLDNGVLRLTLLPKKGGDLYELIHHPSGTQFLMRTPWGLKPPTQQPPSDFLENYEGGWQILFPNINDACIYRGRAIPFHGEAALLSWNEEVLTSTNKELRLKLWVDCKLLPFRLERIFHLVQGEARLELEESVTNFSDQPWDFVWCHHLVLGGNFIEPGCRIETHARSITTAPQLYEPKTARLEEGQLSPWPTARGRNGEEINLSLVPTTDVRSHDDGMLGDLLRGEYTVTNPRLGVGFRLQWDKRVFPWIMFWMPYGGAELPPLTGVYGLGLEPTSAPLPLEQAVSAGCASQLAGGERLSTRVTAEVQTTRRYINNDPAPE